MDCMHDYQRKPVCPLLVTLQFVQKLGASVQIAIYDQRVNLGAIQPRQSALWLGFNCNFHLKATQDAFQNTDFLPVARNHHRGKCHVVNCSDVSNDAVDNQRNEAEFGRLVMS